MIRQGVPGRARDGWGSGHAITVDRPGGRGRDARSHLSAEAGSARLVVIEGEPGVGKTRLLEVAADAVPAAVQVVRARGLQLERERPFWAMVDALELATDPDDERRRSILALLTGEPVDDVTTSTPSDLPMLQFRVVHAMVDLVGTLATERPVVVLVEDLHWVDDASQMMIEQRPRRLADRPLTIVASTRPVSRSPVLDAIKSELTSVVSSTSCWSRSRTTTCTRWRPISSVRRRDLD